MAAQLKKADRLTGFMIRREMGLHGRGDPPLKLRRAFSLATASYVEDEARQNGKFIPVPTIVVPVTDDEEMAP